jgi:hypothetical protein
MPLDIDGISVSERFGWCHINQTNIQQYII